MASVLVLSSVALSSSAHAQTYVSNEVLVRFKSGASSSCRDSALTHLGGTVIDSLKSIDYYVVQLADTSVLAAVAALESSYCVFAAQTNGLATAESPVLLTPNDSLYSTSDYLNNTGQNGGTAGADIDAQAGWNFIHESPNIIIGIFDTGVDYLYQSDLQGNIWTNTGETAGNSTDDDGNGYIDDVYGWDFVDKDNVPWDNYSFNGHGTGTAGRAAARTNNTIGVSGVTWSAKLMSIRVVNAAGSSASEDSMVKAVEYAVDHGAKVLNVSLTYPAIRFGTAFRNAFIAAGDSGLVITCGSGNSGADNDLNLPIPSTIDAVGLISVGGVNRDDVLPTVSSPCPGTSTVPNIGATTVDMAAPACNLTTMYVSNQYSLNASGTSASAPQVAGAAALLFAQNPTWTNVQVKSRLMGTIDTLASCVGKMVAPGRLNLERALDNRRPSPIADLTVESIGRYSQSISWTDTGDDSTWGQARAYTLKRSTSAISTDAQFNSATLVAAGTPGTAGTVHCIDVDGLSSCTTYYWAMRLEDNAFNVSTLNSSVSATTVCSGSSASICPEYFMAEGGDGGGGGGSALTVPFEASAYGMKGASVGSRPVLVSGEERYGWLAENSLRLGAAEPGGSDLLQMRSVQPNANGDYRVRLLALGSQGVDLSSVRLGVVDSPEGSVAVAAGSAVYTGESRGLTSGVTRQGEDATALYSGGGGADQAEGEVLTVTLPAGEGARVLAVELSGLPTDVEHAAGGLQVQTREQGGEWIAVTTLTRRRQAQTAGVFVGTAREIRLVASRPVHVHSLHEVVGATVAEPTWLEVQSREGSGTEGPDGTATLGQSEDLQLLFSGSTLGENSHRSLFLQVAAQAGSGVQASTGAVTGELSFALGSMRPNPAQGRVTIDYVMAREAAVSIRVYNVAGRLVRDLASGTQSAGARSVVWDGRDDSGAAAGKGVYFVRMDVPGWTTQRKMILLSEK